MDKEVIVQTAIETIKSSKFFSRHYSLKGFESDALKKLEKIENSEIFQRVRTFLPQSYYQKVIPLGLVVLSEEEMLRLLELLEKVYVGVEDGLKVFYGVEFWVWLLSVIARLKNDYDYVLVVDGYEGSGKSMSAMSIAYFYRYIVMGESLERHNVVFTPQEIALTFSRWIAIDQHYDVLVVDEGGAALFSRESMSSVTKKFIKIFKIARMMNWFVILVAQNITWLDIYIRKHRLTGWISKQTREEGLFVSGAEFKKYEEWQKEHFDVGAFLKKVKTEKFVFSDFVFDPNFLDDYHLHKQEFVKNSVEELMELVTDQFETAEKRLDKILGRGLGPTCEPYLVTASNYFNASRVFKRLAENVNKGGAVLFSQNFMTLGEDTIGTTLLSKTIPTKDKKLLLENLGLPTEIADFFDICPMYDYAVTPYANIMTYFDMWRVNILGISAFMTQSEIFARNYNPLAYKLVFYYNLLHNLGADSLLKAQLVMYSYFSANIRHKASAYLYNLRKVPYEFDKIFTIVSPEIRITDIRRWMYHNLLEHIQYFYFFFAEFIKQLMEDPENPSIKYLKIRNNTFVVALLGATGDSSKYLQFVRTFANNETATKALGMPVNYDDFEKQNWYDILNKYFYKQYHDKYQKLLALTKDVQTGEYRKVVQALNLIREINELAMLTTYPLSEIKEKMKMLLEESKKYSINSDLQSYILEGINDVEKLKQSSYEEFTKFLIDLYFAQMNYFKQVVEESKEMIERASETALEKLEETTGASTAPSKEELKKEIEELELFLNRIKSLPDFLDNAAEVE